MILGKWIIQTYFSLLVDKVIEDKENQDGGARLWG